MSLPFLTLKDLRDELNDFARSTLRDELQACLDERAGGVERTWSTTPSMGRSATWMRTRLSGRQESPDSYLPFGRSKSATVRFGPTRSTPSCIESSVTAAGEQASEHGSFARKSRRTANKKTTVGKNNWRFGGRDYGLSDDSDGAPAVLNSARNSGRVATSVQLPDAAADDPPLDRPHASIMLPPQRLWRESGRDLVVREDGEKTRLLSSTTVAHSLDDFRSSRKKSQLLKVVSVSWVNSPQFERLTGFVVVLNALFLGWQASYEALCPGSRPSIVKVIDQGFCLVFTLELLVKLKVHGLALYMGVGRNWNYLDTGFVLLQLITLSSEYCSLIDEAALTYLRPIRIVRLVRVLHLFDELKEVVQAMTGTWRSLLRALMLMVMCTYIFSVMFLQSIAHTGQLTEDSELKYWFGGLGRTMLTLFEAIMGGVSWDDVVHPMVRDISPFMGLLFCGYVSVGVLAVLNLVTGIFVENVTKAMLEERDSKLALRIGELFMEGGDIDREITSEEFQLIMSSHNMQDYFKSLDLRPCDAPQLFALLDSDGSGSVDADEIVTGCLSLRGTAKGLDVCLILREITNIGEMMEQFLADFHREEDNDA